MIVDILVAVAFRGGVEEVINSTAKYIEKKGDKVRIIQGIWQGEPWGDPSIEFHILCDATKGEWGNDLNLLIDKYSEFIGDYGKPDVVLAAGWPMLVPIAKKAGVNNGETISVVSWMHDSLESYASNGLGGYDELSYADAHFVINDKLGEGIEKHLSKGNVVRVRNPVNLARIRYNEKRDLHKLAYVGRLAPEKNIPYLLQCISRTEPIWSLDLVGDEDPEGRIISAYKDYAEELGIADRVTFYGWKDNPWEVLSNNGALLLTSDREGAPLVIAEALLCGMFVISTPTNGPLERIKVGENGFVIPFNDTGFFVKLLTLLDSGAMPIPSSRTCRESVAYLLQEEELDDFYNKLKIVVSKT